MNWNEQKIFDKIVYDIVDLNPNSVDAIERYLGETINTMTIYDDDCIDIIKDLQFDIFTDSELGKNTSWSVSASNALYEFAYNEGLVPDITHKLGLDN